MDIKKLVFAIVGIVAGVAICFVPAPEGLTPESMRVIGVLVWAIIFWIGNVLPEAVTAMLMSVLFIVVSGGLVGVGKSFSAFAGSTIWLVIAAIALGVSVKACGLLERVSLLLLKLFPKNFFGQSLGLMLSTFVVGPFVPSTMAKTGILTTVARGITESAGYEVGGKQSNGLFLSYWNGLKSCSTMFITASVVSAALVGMLPEDVAAEYGIAKWALMAIPTMVVFFVITFAYIQFAYGDRTKKSAEEKKASADAITDYIKGRLAELGSWKVQEKIVAAIIVVTVILWLTKSYHGIAEWIITCFAMTACFVFKIIDIKTFKTGVPWEVIIFVGCAISIGSVLPEVGIIDWLMAVIGPMTESFFANPFLMVVGVAVFAYLVRFVIVSESGFLAVATALLFPLALSAGINPWVVAFVLNAITNTFQLPYQSSLLIGTAGVGGTDFVKYGEASKFNVVFCLAYVVGFLVSVPFWLATGVMYV